MWKRLQNIINYLRLKANIQITEERIQFADPTLNCEQIIKHPQINKFLWLRETVDAVKSAYANYKSQLTSYNRHSLFFDGIWGNIDKFQHAQNNVQVALDKLNASLNHLSQQLVGGLELLTPDADWSGIAARGGEDHKVIQDFTNKANQQLELLLNCISDQSPAKCYFVGKLNLRAYRDQMHALNTSSEELLQQARDNIHDALNRGYYTWEEAEGLYCHALFAIELEKQIDVHTPLAKEDAKKLHREARELLQRLHEAGYMPASYKLKEIYADAEEFNDRNYEQETFAHNLKLAQANYLPAMKVIADWFIRAVSNARMGRKEVGNELGDNDIVLQNILATEATRQACINVIARGIYYQCDFIMLRVQDLESGYLKVSSQIDGVLKSAHSAEVKGVTSFTESVRKELSPHTQWLGLARQMLNSIALATKSQYSPVMLEAAMDKASQTQQQSSGGFYAQVSSLYQRIRAVFVSRRDADKPVAETFSQSGMKLHSIPAVRHTSPEIRARSMHSPQAGS